MKKAVWISFDFGIRGDYEGMYLWLDQMGAKECGDGVAFLRFQPKKDLVLELKKQIKQHVTIDKRTRIYMIYLNDQKKDERSVCVRSS